MTLITFCLSISLGAIIGLVYYGLSFGTFLKKDPSVLQPLSIGGYAALRLALLSFLFYVLLRLPLVSPILVVTTYLMLCWALILGKDLGLWNRLRA